MPAPLTRKTLNGVWAALIVPWTDRDELDEARWVKECRSYAGTGVSGIYTGGTTGEFYAQDDATYERLTAIACREAHAVGLPIQIGATALSTRTARLRIRTALKHGADAVQIALPFWLELKPDEGLAFMKDIAQTAGSVPIVLYTTSRAKYKPSPKDIGVMARQVPTFIGMKDTGSDPATVAAILKEAPDLAIFGGENFLERAPIGGRGGYCSIVGINARYIVEYYNLCAAGRLEEAKPYDRTIKRLLDEALLPMVTRDGLWDSAIDRVQRMVGGGDVGLNCMGPYRRATPAHVEAVRKWCEQNAPALLAPQAVRV